MSALTWITNEAKRLRRKYPKRFKTWREYVKQASAIYAKKHKGKSPGKPHSKKKRRLINKLRKTTRVGSVKARSPGMSKHTVLQRGAVINLRSIQHPLAGSFRNGSATVRRIDKRNSLIAASGTASLPGKKNKRVSVAIPLSYLRQCGYVIT